MIQVLLWLIFWAIFYPPIAGLTIFIIILMIVFAFLVSMYELIVDGIERMDNPKNFFLGLACLAFGFGFLYLGCS